VELAERVCTAGPRIVLLGAVLLLLVATPRILRFWAFLPGVTT
jgi:hypothetical protein